MTVWRRFARFQVVGATGIGVQLGTLAVLTAAGVHHLPATMAAVLTALGHNFAWHRRWTWRDRRATAWPRQFAAFVSANGLVSLLGNVLITAGVVSATGVSPVAANAVAIVCCGLANFWLGHRVVFPVDAPSA